MVCHILHRKIIFIRKVIFQSITKCLNTVLEKYIVTGLDFSICFSNRQQFSFLSDISVWIHSRFPIL